LCAERSGLTWKGRGNPTSVFIELSTDAFSSVFNNQAGNGVARRAGVSRARRPLRGLEIKDDTYAILKVVQADGTEVKLVDSGSLNGETTQYSNFILQSVREARMEKHQIVETFGEPYIFFFGESPRFLDVQAILVDSLDFNWYAEFWENYNTFLRGTKSVEMGARTYLFYDDNVLEGYMLMAQAEKVAERPLMATLSFRLYLTNYQNISMVGDPNYPIRPDVNVPADVLTTTADLSTAGNAIMSSVSQATLQEAASLQAAQGAAQQNTSGFGGTPSLTSALTQGITATGNPSIDGVLQNAAEALAIAQDGGVTRQSPLRGLISDNVDEYTALLPPAAPTYGSTDLNSEVQDLSQSLVDQADLFGADIDGPFNFNLLGLLPFFGSFLSFGLFGGLEPGASFGVTGFGTSAYSGINGGLGFTGAFTGAPSLQTSIQQQQQNNASVGVSAPIGAPVYGNGVPISGGVISGTGAAGGIPGGYSQNVGSPVTIGASPGGTSPSGVGAASVAQPTGGAGQTALQQYLGGPSFGAGPSGFSSTGGFNGSTGAGASIAVDGTPTLFSMAIVPGTLQLFQPSGDNRNFYIGTDGNLSTVNETGLTV
jgi:hypothetical protein